MLFFRTRTEAYARNTLNALNFKTSEPDTVSASPVHTNRNKTCVWDLGMGTNIRILTMTYTILGLRIQILE